MRKIFRSVSLLAALALVFSISGVTTASADSGSASFLYLIGTDPLCGLPPDARGPACPMVMEAANGHTIEMTGAGTLSIHPKSVTGGGTFTHKDADGNILASGIWEATQLLSFHSYGSGAAQGFPPETEGGQAAIHVQLFVDGDVDGDGTPVADGVLQVDCTLGDKIPASSVDEARLAVQGGPNFNQDVSGFTLFIRLP